MPAEDHLRRALETFRALHDPSWQASTLRSLGVLHGRRGDHVAAEERFTQAANLARGLDNPRQYAIIQVCIGEWQESRGRVDLARLAFRSAVEALAKSGARRWYQQAVAGLDRVGDGKAAPSRPQPAEFLRSDR